MDHEEFERLNLEEQERIFHQTPFKERGDLLLRCHNPVRLAQSLSQEELYLVTREMDLEERSEILRYASLPQLFFISDIDCWKKDRLDIKGFLQWLEVLKEADEEKLLAWLVNMDYETVVTGFQGLIRVLKPEWEYPSDELLGDRPYFTLDERYFISVREENLETVKRAIEVLYENHRGRYVAVLEGILGELEYELEEEAFQNRSRRLAERGFPHPETAHHIYRALSREDFEKFPQKNGRHQTFDERNVFEAKAPHYLVFRSTDRLFLDEVLLLFRGEEAPVREGLEEELAWLSNKIIACHGIDFASEERVRQGVEQARFLVSMGLEDLSLREVYRAKEILKERWLELIFRWGMTCLLELREEANRVFQAHWGGERKHFLEFLDEPYQSIFRGLFHFIPQFHDPRVLGSLARLRDFKSMEEIGKTQASVAQIAGIHEMLAREFPTLLPRLNVEIRRSDSHVSLFSLLGNLFVSWAVTGRASSRALSEKEVLQFLREGFEQDGSRRILERGQKEKFVKRFFPSPQAEKLATFFSLFFARLEEELGRLDPGRPIDPRFLTSLFLREARARVTSNETD